MLLRYNELLDRKLKELRTDVHTFFRICYCYKFGCDAQLEEDMKDYVSKKEIPIYVREYLDMEKP